LHCGHEADRVKAAVAPTGVKFVMQEQQLGTGHALQMLKAYFALTGEALPKHLLVLSGDVPLIRPETITTICELHLAEKAAMTILTAEPQDPTGYGRVIRVNENAPEVVAIVEQRSLTPEQLGRERLIQGSIASRRRLCSRSSICSRLITRRGSFT